MDKIYIKDLEIYAFHGVNKEEKKLGQKYLISVELSLSLREAGQTDDLSNTVNYGELSLRIEKEFLKNKNNLIEKCGEDLAKFILLNYPPVHTVKVLIKKPWAPIGKALDYAAIEITRSWHKVFIGLGSNVGDKEDNIKKALKSMDNSNSRVVKVSKLYNTKPVGYLDQEDFVNCVAEIATLLMPKELMRELLQFELDLKRERTIMWGPRTIDLDVLLYDEEIISEAEIIVPHPRMHERLFVLRPLCDIAPNFLHPILKKRISQLEAEISKTQSLD